MSFKAGNWKVLDFLVLLNPLTLHLGLEILANFKVFESLLEYLLDQDLIDILEVNLISFALIGLNLVGGEDFEDILLLDDYVFLLVDVERVFVVHHILFLLEFALGGELVVISDFLASKWWWKLNDQADKVVNTNPACSFTIILLPGINKCLDVITCNDSRVLLFGIFETLNNCSYREVHDQPGDDDSECEEIVVGKVRAAAAWNLVVSDIDGVVVVRDAVSSVFGGDRELVHDFVPILTS